MGANNVLGGISNLMNNTISGAENAVAELQAEANANGGMLDPAQMIQLQMAVVNMTTVLQTSTSMVKDLGDLDKTIATNIGS